MSEGEGQAQMQRFSHAAVGVCRGSAQLFQAFVDDGPMWVAEGPREERKRVDFPESFLSAPIVQVSISMWDIDNNANLRADITAECVTRTGFEIVFRTWADTRVARIRADWLAIGETTHSDDFHV